MEQLFHITTRNLDTYLDISNYTVAKKRYECCPNNVDKTLIVTIDNLPIPYWFPAKQITKGDKTGEPIRLGISYVHHFYTRRSLLTLGKAYTSIQYCPDNMSKYLLFTVQQAVLGMAKISRYVPTHFSQVNQYLSGTLYIGSQVVEVTLDYILGGKVSRLISLLRNYGFAGGGVRAQSASATNPGISGEQVDYIFTDPPFGGNLMYSELNFLWEAWLKVQTNNVPEAIANDSQKKKLPEYQALMTRCFAEYYHVLKPGHWMTVEFHNSANAVWNAIQEGLERVGFIVADVRVLSKKQGTFNAVMSSGAVKEDLVISCYKPRHEFEERFQELQGKPEGVIEFIREHLSMLPVAPINKSKKLEAVAERTRFLLFDRMVAYHLQRGARIPLSATDFYRMLEEQFVERDEMYFLPDQAARYDAVKARGVETEQLSIFVRDEKTAVQWVRSRLMEQPQTLGDLTPKFMQELREWESHEPRPELRDLLREYFIEGAGIWRVPDPNNEKDLEALRRNALLKLFRDYVNAKGPLKVFRKEAVMEGFRHCWDTKQYGIITAICEKIPTKVLQEIHEFVQFYDIAKDLAPETVEQMAFSWE